MLENDVDICCISETWMKTGDNALIVELNEKGYSFFHDPRSGRGGGTGVLYKSNLKMTKQNTPLYKSFEVTETLVRQNHSKIRICAVYRSINKASVPDFLSEFEQYLQSLNAKSGKPLICGDFNFHIENSADNTANQFLSLISILGFEQHVNQPTHKLGGILDLVLTSDDSLPVTNISVEKETGTSTDHFLVTFYVPHPKTSPNGVWEWKEYRKLKDIDIEKLKADITTSDLCTSNFSSIEAALVTYNKTLLLLLNKHAPLEGKYIKTSLDPWWNRDCQLNRSLRRRAERRYKKHKTINQ